MMELHGAFRHGVTRDDRTLPTGHGCILAIDDEEFVLELEKQMLERLGYEVVAMNSSPDALREFHAEPDRFDLVITDMTMPKMTGAKLAQKILSARRDIPIILCTGFSELIDEEGAKSIGIAAYLTKPFTYAKFSKTIRSVIGGERG
jgi:two-component system, cell cycle sensor histidine kinase and response regulator CckA